MKRHLPRTLLYSMLCIATIETIDIARHPETTDEQRAQAVAYVEANDLDMPPQPFTQDGCTLFPDKILDTDFRDACLGHDIAYWAGGPLEMRTVANEVFERQAAELGFLGRALGPLLFYGTEYFGNNTLTDILDADWGYGWK